MRPIKYDVSVICDFDFSIRVQMCVCLALIWYVDVDLSSLVGFGLDEIVLMRRFLFFCDTIHLAWDAQRNVPMEDDTIRAIVVKLTPLPSPPTDSA